MPRDLRIEKLADEFGDYLLILACRACGHVRRSPPHALARLCGWETPVRQIEKRLRCSKCGAHRCALTAVSVMKPRGIKDPRT